ncbi:zinc finger protein ztf-16-like [Musca vetustissima]|uniref:zinc finger protein ztf-16-like n=1 Tax=Musca vetustissima TaxID=27455 RepID=UPI002AB7D329|nr:zinc finger protein ztf-16-like [Musca vetustissima]
MSQPKRKFCRVCLKEIRSTLSRIYHILEPPEPVIKLRDDRKAATYLQCYYYCIRNGGTDHFNVDSLMDYAYLCTKCRLQLTRTLDFIIKSQRNEDFLMSMYEKSTHVVSYSSAEATADDGDDDDLEDELLHGNKTDDNTTIDLEYELFDAHHSRKTEDETQSDGSHGEDEEETDLLEECLDPNDETMRDYQNSVEHSDSELDINEILDELSKDNAGSKAVTTEKELQGSKNTVVDFEEVLIETENAELPPKRTFAIKTHYDQHRKKHEGVRYRCQVCDKEFGHMFSLRQHSFKHRGYPFSCKLCGKGLPAVFKMRVHLKTRHRKVFNGEYSDEEADQYIIRNNIEKMYPCVEVLPDKIVR